MATRIKFRNEPGDGFNAHGYCTRCGKKAYDSRASARRNARRIGGDHMACYRCPHHEQWWHVGHLPAAVRNGEIDRDEYRQNALRRQKGRGQ